MAIPEPAELGNRPVHGVKALVAKLFSRPRGSAVADYQSTGSVAGSVRHPGAVAWVRSTRDLIIEGRAGNTRRAARARGADGHSAFQMEGRHAGMVVKVPKPWAVRVDDPCPRPATFPLTLRADRSGAGRQRSSRREPIWTAGRARALAEVPAVM